MKALNTLRLGWLCLLLTMSCSAQIETQSVAIDPSRMSLPPVFQNVLPSVDATTTGNDLSYGVVTSSAYNDNVLPEESSRAIEDSSYSMHPMISLDQSGNRLTQQLAYSLGFTVYQKTSVLNEFDQHLTENLQDRLSENMTLSVQENLDKSSNVFSGQASAFQSGLPPLPISGTVAPYADQFSNALSLGWRYQYSENNLVGVVGNYSVLHYTHPAQTDGLANNSTVDASGFYLHRVDGRHYLGALYQFARLTVSPNNAPDLHIRLNAIAGSYTLYFSRSMLISVAAGPQHLQLEGSQYPQYESWKPWIEANLTLQNSRTALIGSFSRTASTAGGLQGVFETDAAGLSGRWQSTLNWTFGASGSYFTNHPETPFLTGVGGHGYSTSFITMRRLGEYWNLQFEYDRLFQRYPGLVEIANNPLSNREAISLSYSIKRHLAQ